MFGKMFWVEWMVCLDLDFLFGEIEFVNLVVVSCVEGDVVESDDVVILVIVGFVLYFEV